MNLLTSLRKLGKPSRADLQAENTANAIRLAKADQELRRWDAWANQIQAELKAARAQLHDTRVELTDVKAERAMYEKLAQKFGQAIKGTAEAEQVEAQEMHRLPMWDDTTGFFQQAGKLNDPGDMSHTGTWNLKTSPEWVATEKLLADRDQFDGFNTGAQPAIPAQRGASE